MIKTEKLTSAISRITLDRPLQMNALTDAMAADLQHALSSVGADDTCRVIILAGSGRAFCAGLDLKDNIAVHGQSRSDVDEAMALQLLYAGLPLTVRRLRQPVVAAINGAAIGAGLGLALSADIRVAGRSANFHVGAVKVGLSAGECGISYHLPRLVGAGRAAELMLTGRPVYAEEASRIGLVSSLVDDDCLQAAALEMAESIVANTAFSVEQTKRVMWANLDAARLDSALELENRTQIMAMLRPDFAQAVEAFATKRHSGGRP